MPEMNRSAPHETDDVAWLDVVSAAHIEVSSEDELFPIEQALGPDASLGWRAARPGPQTLRLNFHRPLQLRLIYLHFIERASERTQEFTLRYTMAGGDDPRELCRRQFHFSPGATTEEIEELAVDLQDVVGLELEINPDVAHSRVSEDVYATLVALRLSAQPPGITA